MKLTLLLSFLLLLGVAPGNADGRLLDRPNGQKLIIVTLDGYRWQELFGGADPALLNDPRWTADTAGNRRRYWHEDPQRRREKLMPFFWNVIAQQGQLHGNRLAGSRVNTRNIWQLSYPGYNELLTGRADPFIATNKLVPNRNRSILEYLNGVPEYAGQVAAFASWEAFPWILNRRRSGIHVDCGTDERPDDPVQSPSFRHDLLLPKAHHSRGTRDDRLTFVSAMDYLKRHQPKVLFIGFSGTDDAGHEKSYDRYLHSAAEADRMIAELWEFVQTHPMYRSNTSLLITTDHGRGSLPHNWFNHGFFVGGSSQTWIAMIGSGVLPLGECRDREQLYQKHIAGTVGQLLGFRSHGREGLPLSFFNMRGTEGVAASRPVLGIGR